MSSFLGFPSVGQVVAVLPESRGVSKESEFPHTLPRPVRGLRWSAAMLQTRRLIHGRACLGGRCSYPSLPRSSYPTMSGLWLTWLYPRVGGGPDCTENGVGWGWVGGVFAQYVIKTVTLCHHHTQVLILLLDNLPVSLKGYFWMKRILSHSDSCIKIVSKAEKHEHGILVFLEHALTITFYLFGFCAVIAFLIRLYIYFCFPMAPRRMLYL